MERKILNLVLKAEWYEMIASGEKKEEYREIKPYWEKRLLDYRALGKFVEENRSYILAKRMFFPFAQVVDGCKDFPRGFTHVKFHYGYTSKSMLVECKGIEMGFGREEWGAPKDLQVFIIKLGKIVEE